MLQIEKLRVEYRENPIGLDVAKPRFSWILKTEKENCMQSSGRKRNMQTGRMRMQVIRPRKMLEGRMRTQLRRAAPASGIRYVWKAISRCSWSMRGRRLSRRPHTVTG